MKIRRWFVLAMALLLVLAACSGGDDSAAEEEPHEQASTTTAPATTGQADPSDAEASSSTTDAPAGEDETTADSSSTSLATGGAVDDVNRTQFSIHDTILVNAEPESFLLGEPAVADQSWWITTIEIESLAFLEWRITQDNFLLELDDGTRIAADDIFNEVGSDVLDISLAGRERRVARLSFAPPGEGADLSSADLIVLADDDAIELRLPLEGSEYLDPYPIALLDGQEASIATGSFGGCFDGATFLTNITESSIGLEGFGQGSGSYELAAEGQRVFNVLVRAIGTQSTSSSNNATFCGQTIQWPDFQLVVDGETFTGEIGLRGPDIDDFGSGLIPLSFTIPTSAKSIELFGGADGDLVASWDVELPPAAGESEDAPVPFKSAVEEPKLDGPIGDRPEAPQTNELGAGGATHTWRLVEVSVGSSTATNESENGEATRRTALLVEVAVESSEETVSFLSPENFVLVDPSGNARSADDWTDRSGNDLLIVELGDGTSQDVILEFETDGLVSNLASWSIRVEFEDDVPLVLPLTGDAPGSGFPLGLRVGDNAEISTPSFPGCSEPLIDVTVQQITVNIEGAGHLWQGWTRTNRDHLLIPIDLIVRSLVDDSGGALSTLNCDELTLFPEFLLFADGVPLNAFSYVKPTVPFGEGDTVPVTFEIPIETQRIRLTDGSGEVTIGEWELRDAGEVLDDFEPKTVDDQIVITLDETLLFAFGESTVQQSALPALNRLAQVLLSESAGDVGITGHTDSIGSDESNQQLSEARAEAVAAVLVDAGVAADRLVTSGAGESQPVAPNENDDGSDNPEGRQQNRRVEVSFSSN